MTAPIQPQRGSNRARLDDALIYALLFIAGAAVTAALIIAIYRWAIVGVTLAVAVLAFAAGVLFGERARARYRDIAYWSGERMDAWRAADTATDLDVVGPVTGERKAVEK